MKTYIISIVFFLVYPLLGTFVYNKAEDIGESVMRLMPESTLEIQGKTNINKFNCIFGVDNITSPFQVNFQESENNLTFKNTQIVLDNDCFDCGNNMMNKDLRKLLKSEDYPNIKLALVQVHKTSKKNGSLAEVDISLAGITKRYFLAVNVIQGQHLSYSGSMDLDINDFNLEPPKKLMGAVKVNNIIQIVFDLKVTPEAN